MASDEHGGSTDGTTGGRIGIFGGTFDPPHVGHLVVAGDVARHLDLDRMIWLPAGHPPHKATQVVSPGSVRLAMTRAAVHGDPRFEVSDAEIRRPGPSYTVDTLRALAERYPDARLFLVIGADQLRAFHTWRDPSEIARLARVVVMDRDGCDAGTPDPGLELEWERVPVTRIDISSTDIRERVAGGESVRHLVPETVRRIIEDQGLYARGS